MKIAAVVAEYNPFHNGHAHQLAAARQQGATHLAVVMGGNFLQRGSAAQLEKRTRAAAALSCGADLILELPLPYAMATAERFAFGAVSLMKGLGCVDALSFGCETADTDRLLAAADLPDRPEFSAALRKELDRGITFAAARQNAAEALLGPEAAALLGRPNNILAVEYLRQCRLLGLSPELLPVPRTGMDHDAAGSAGGIASASYIRSVWGTPEALELVPAPCRPLYEEASALGREPDPLRLEAAMVCALRSRTREELASLPDLSEGLENRLYQAIRQGCSVEEILRLTKSKRYPLARVRRLVCSAFLGLDGSLCRRTPPYLRVLGYNSRGLEILKRARNTASLPLSDSLARLRDSDELCRLYAETESRAADLYSACLKAPRPCGTDYTDNPVRMLF